MYWQFENKFRKYTTTPTSLKSWLWGHLWADFNAVCCYRRRIESSTTLSIYFFKIKTFIEMFFQKKSRLNFLGVPPINFGYRPPQKNFKISYDWQLGRVPADHFGARIMCLLPIGAEIWRVGFWKKFNKTGNFLHFSALALNSAWVCPVERSTVA